MCRSWSGTTTPSRSVLTTNELPTSDADARKDCLPSPLRWKLIRPMRRRGHGLGRRGAVRHSLLDRSQLVGFAGNDSRYSFAINRSFFTRPDTAMRRGGRGASRHLCAARVSSRAIPDVFAAGHVRRDEGEQPARHSLSFSRLSRRGLFFFSRNALPPCGLTSHLKPRSGASTDSLKPSARRRTGPSATTCSATT